MNHPHIGPPCGRIRRRTFLADLGLGFTGLALGALLHRDGIARAETAAWAPPSGRPMFPPKAKSVIWIFLSGGYSHVETFDPKPALTKYGGKTFEETPFPNPVLSPLHAKRARGTPAAAVDVRKVYPTIMPMQVDFRKHGQSGIEMTDWWPHLATCVDDLAFVRNMYTTDNDHFAENQMHTGRHRLDEVQPCIGSWIHYGLGSANDNLPSYVVLGGPTRGSTIDSISADYLGPQHAGVPMGLDPANPLPFGARPAGITAQEQANEYELIGELNRMAGVEYPDDASIRARIRAYELAFRMQTSVPEVLNLGVESKETQELYGLDQAETKLPGQRMLAARRMVERGVRFVQVFPTSYGTWDSHAKLKENHTKLCAQVDKPVAGLLKDLKQRGLLEETVVVFCTEFGRTPGMETRSGKADGRDHHPHGFTIWLAGAGLQRGVVHGETDELGFHAAEPAHYVTDVHATVLRLLGLDGRRLEIPGRKRLDMDHGKAIAEILA
ncbi:MAG TPA: DUF1501 domain-containing protein [Chthoniobacteraceae bacterium]|nr:DUF1501 domain-containing protein [Chthoniobacteraceae bacterium]